MLNKVRFDWFSFTIKNKDIHTVLSDLGCDIENYTSKPFGRFGYGSVIAHDVYPITFMYDGTEEMGVHCTIGGSAIKHFFESYLSNCPRAIDTPFDSKALCKGTVEDFATYVLANGRFSRVDVNIDTDMEEMHPKRIYERVESSQMISKYRSWKLIESSDKSATLYIGKRTSSSMIRLYDKAKEQGDFDSTLYRFEVQFNAYADSFMRMFLEFGLGTAFHSFVRGALRFVDAEKNYDMKASEFWQNFLNLIQHGSDVEFIKYDEKKNRTSITSIYHMFNQYGNVIADFFENFGNADDFMEFCIHMMTDDKTHTNTLNYLSQKGWWI